MITLPLETIVNAALLEDLDQGDLTVDNLPVLMEKQGQAVIMARSACVVSGLSVAEAVFRQVDDGIVFEPSAEDGDEVTMCTVLATVSGPVASLLKAERTALNFMQHLSGIATETRRYAVAIEETPAKITNTRKTTPGLRLLEREAVVHGGGSPHRYNLGSAVMLKDNHLQYVSITDAVQTLRGRVSHTATIEVECDRLDQVREALSVGADIIMLDNMAPDQVREAVALIGERAITEASGNITLETVRDYALAGVNYISTSKITLGAPAVDIGLDMDLKLVN